MQPTLIISGGSSGIGEATIQTFLDNNYRVFNLDIQQPTLQHDHLIHFHCDASQPGEIQQAVEKVMKIADKVDALVCCAGKHLSATIENTSVEQFDDVVNVNVKGTFFLIKAVIPFMKQQHSGRIVIIGSEQSFVGKKHSAAYGLSKAAIGQLTKSVAIDYAGYQITCNCICAGTIDTPLYRHAIENYSQAHDVSLTDIEKKEASLQPLNRIGVAREVASLAFYLCSDDAGFMTGGLIPIDGGYSAQ